MKHIIQLLFATSILCWLSACSNISQLSLEATPPIVTQIGQPESVNKSEIAKQETDISRTPSATSNEIVESVSRSPLASPTVTPLPKEPTQVPKTPTSPPSATPTTVQQPPITSTPSKEAPAPTVIIISDEPLLSDEQLSAMGVQENEPVSVVTWPTENEIVVQVGYQPDASVWAVSKDEETVQQVPNWQPQDSTSQQAVEELQKYNEGVDYAVVSPDGQWAVWGQGETLLVKRLGADEPPVDLLGKQYENLRQGAGRLVWSPDSKYITYVVENGNFYRYEIRISDPLGQRTILTPLWDTNPSHISWSPDSQYLAFVTLEQPQSGIVHLYLIEQNGSTPAQLTKHGLANGPIHWAPTNNAIAYTYELGDDARPWLVQIEPHQEN